MLEDSSSYTLKPHNLKYLAPMVMHNSLDKHYYISLLFRIKNSGAHYILCERLKYMDIKDEIPQLIEIMLRDTEDAPISHPVYKLLWFKAKRHLSFRIDLFLRLKSVLSTVDESKASHCYFLCCDILDIDKSEHKRNLKTLSNRFRFIKKLRMKYKRAGGKCFRSRYYLATRTFSMRSKCKSPIFQGLMLFFAKAVTSIFDSPLFGDLDRFSRVFNNKKNFKSLQLRSSETRFKSNIKFLESMVNISNRLKKIPPQLRSKALTIELGMLNHELCNDIFNPFDGHTKIVNFLLDHAKALDSAENCPYLVLIECAHRKPETGSCNTSRLKRARGLRNQLESLNDLGDIGDVDGIRESILNAMKNILFGASETRIQSNEKCPSSVDLQNASKSTEPETRSMVEVTKEDYRPTGTNPRDFSSENACSFDTDRQAYLHSKNEAEELAISPSLCLNTLLISESSVQVYFDESTEAPSQELASPSVIASELEAEASLASQENLKYDTLVSSGNFDEFVPCSGHQYSLLVKDSEILQDPVFDEKNTADRYSNVLEIYETIYDCDGPGSPQIIKETEKSSSSIKKRLSGSSKFAGLPGWDIKSFIVKSGGVIKHEYIAYQILTQIKEIFIIEKLPIYIRNYKIILISDTSGLVETVQDAISVHRIKADSKFSSLAEYFNENFAGENLLKARENFLHSLVGYSLASYLLQIKDRHNGNIMIDSFGHIIHVDFGFVFGRYPGILYLESAPFKFSAEYLELIDLEQFKSIFIRGFKILRKHKEKLTRLVEIMEDTGYCDKFTFSAFLDRLRMGDSERDIEAYCHGLISKSIKNMGTMFYDQIQYLSNGYL